jgi:hypothetical protein
MILKIIFIILCVFNNIFATELNNNNNSSLGKCKIRRSKPSKTQ